MRYLYAIIILMVLAVGWQAWSTASTWHFLEKESIAQSYGASPDKAKVTIIAFISYTSSASKAVSSTAMSVVLEQPDVRIIFHPIMSNKLAVHESAIALAAGMQGKFIEMHEELMRAPAVLSDDDIRAIATRLKLDPDRLFADAGSAAVLQKLKREVAAASTLKINMVPLFLLNRRTLFGPDSLEKFRDDFSEIIKKVRAL